MSVSILGALLLSTLTVTDRSAGAFRTGAVVTQLQADGLRALDRIVRRLEATDLDLVVPRLASPFSSSSVDFQLPLGFDGENVVWGPLESISFVLDSGEVEDGADNDGDGLVDEGRVVWTENPATPDARSFGWVSGVRNLLEGEVLNGLDDNGNGLIDEPGLAFSYEGSLLTVRLTLERLEARGGRTMIGTVETSIRLRN